MPSARRNFLTDSILGALLAPINTPVQQAVLSSVFQDVDNSNDALPNVMYGIVDEATPKDGDDKLTVSKGISRFGVLCYFHGVTDAAQSGVNRKAINEIVAQVESLINAGTFAATEWQDSEDVKGAVHACYTTDITSVPDFGDPFSAFQVNGMIEWSTGYDAS